MNDLVTDVAEDPSVVDDVRRLHAGEGGRLDDADDDDDDGNDVDDEKIHTLSVILSFIRKKFSSIGKKVFFFQNKKKVGGDFFQVGCRTRKFLSLFLLIYFFAARKKNLPGAVF